jgi:hypothetical protein
MAGLKKGILSLTPLTSSDITINGSEKQLFCHSLTYTVQVGPAQSFPQSGFL